MTQHKTSHSDLEYLAGLGFEKISFEEADLLELKQRWAKRNSAAYYRWSLFLMGIFLGLNVFFAAYDVPFEFGPVSSTAAPAPAAKVEEPAVALDTITILAENFKKTEAKKSTEPAVPLSDELIEPAAGIESLPLMPLPGANVADQKLKPQMSGPAFYIHDLKVSNYGMLYFKKKSFAPMKSVPASYTSKYEREGDRPLEPPTYLHEKLGDALLYYKQGHYTQCILALNEVAEIKGNDVNCNFYRGMSYYKLQKPDQAISYLQLCIEDLDNAFLQESEYYKALSLFMAGEEKEAVTLLRKIANDGDFYSDKARKLLAEKNLID